ncbi:MAG TPA: hypothetical protein PKA58_34805, partial [Polyangium sp.]|nr:hypothetical protein [Polyangium sp.]
SSRIVGSSCARGESSEGLVRDRACGWGGWVRRGEEEGRSVHEEPISVVWVSGLVVGPEIPLTKFGRREANGLALCAVNRTFGKVWHGYTDLLALRRATAEHF